MNEDAELLMSLYDGKEGLPFTENYVVRWSKEGFVRDINQLHSLRVLFTVDILFAVAILNFHNKN